MKTYLYLTAQPLPIILQHIFRWLLLPLLLLTWSLTSYAQSSKAIASKKVVLNWNTPVTSSYSHFVIERSLNNADFSTVGLLFTSDDEEAVNKSYSFSDDVQRVRKGIIYYRINMVDMNGKVQKSANHTVYTTDHKPTPEIKVSPNPVVNDLHITLPKDWKDKYVSIELVNSNNGQVVKYSLSQHAALTEVISVKELVEGIYVLRVSNGNETIIQRIIKSK